MECFVIDSDGDLEIVVDNSKFRISSAKMASLSPKFDEVFGNCRAAPEITFPTSAEVFRCIAQSAHGYFVPQAEISLDVLLSLASVINSYEVPATTPLYALVNFSYVVQTLRPGQISVGKLVTLLQIAKALDSSKLANLLLGVFDGRPKALNWSFSNIEADDCVLLLVNILMRITKARDGIVKAITAGEMTYTLDACFGFFQELRHVAGWILQDQPSLHEIQLRLEQFQICEEPNSEESLVQDTLRRCWTALRLAREEVREFVQRFVVQKSETIRTMSNSDSTCKSLGCGSIRSEPDFAVNDEYDSPHSSDGDRRKSRANSVGAYFHENECCDGRDDWMEVISDTASVKSCQTI